MIMKPKVNFQAGEMGFMFCNLYLSLKQTFAWDINSTNLPCLTSVLPGDTSDSWNFSSQIYNVSYKSSCLWCVDCNK